MSNLINIIEDLSNTFGPSGFEDDVLKVIKKHATFTDATQDSINNLFLSLQKVDSKKPTIALDCHTDEVGFIVEHINKNGTISFLQLGGWFSASVPSHSVVIKNSNGEYIKGVVGSKPPHFLTAEELTKLPKISDMYIDIGTSSAKETRDIYGIDVGDPIAPEVTFSYDEKIKVMRGKAFDNRLGCSAVIKTLEVLKDSKNLNVNLVGAMSSQEEVGLRGATVSANRIKPDFAIVFEGSPADDTFKDEYSSHGAMRKGVQLRVIDGQMISNQRVIKYAKEVAEKNNIKYQVIAREKGSTNGASYHKSNFGVPSLVLGLPTRYIHTHYSYASYEDLEGAIELAKCICEDLTAEKIKTF